MSNTQPQLELLLTCQECGYSSDIDGEGFDGVGACYGNLFCLGCGLEIDSETGAKAELCGKCFACQELEADRPLKKPAKPPNNM